MWGRFNIPFAHTKKDRATGNNLWGRWNLRLSLRDTRLGWMLQPIRASPAETVIMICYEHINVKGQSELKRKRVGTLEFWYKKKTVWGEHIMTTKTGSRNLSISLLGVLWSLSLENSITGKQHEMWRTWALSQLFFPLLWPNPSTSKERWYLSTHSLRVQSTMTGKEGQAAGHIGPSQEAERMHGGPQLHFLLCFRSGTPTFGRISPHSWWNSLLG